MSDISKATWGGYGWVCELLTGQPALHDVIIDHNTMFVDHASIYLGDAGTMSNIQITNNISDYGLYGVQGNGTSTGTPALDTYAPGYIWNDMAWIDASGNPQDTYPSGTFWSTQTGVHFTSVTGTDPALSGNFQLTSSSPYYHAGTDGKDIGVWDWTTFNTETTNALNGNYLH
jgi:hypothetical protein